MDLKNKSLPELKKLREAYRPEAISQLFFIVALILSTWLSMSFTIILDWARESFPKGYLEFRMPFALMGIGAALAFSWLAYSVSVTPHDKVADEILRREKRKKAKTK